MALPIAPIVTKIVKKIIIDKAVKNIDKIIIFLLVVFMITTDVVPMFALAISQSHNQPESNVGSEGSLVYGPVVEDGKMWSCPKLSGRVGINAPFGYSEEYFGGSIFHPGLDLDFRFEKVRSITNGRVVFAGWDNVGLGGWMIVVESGEYRVWYAHLSNFIVLGGEVKMGDVIAVSGNSSSGVVGAHLHISILKNLQQMNPMLYIPPECTK